MKKTITLVLLVVVPPLVAWLALVGLCDMRPDRWDEILMEYEYRHAVPPITVIDGNRVNTHKSGKDQ